MCKVTRFASAQTSVFKQAKLVTRLQRLIGIGLDMNKRSKSFAFALISAALVLSGGCSKAPEPSASLDHVTDIEVSEHVKTALLGDELLKEFDITVVTLNGDVRLIGVLESQAQIDEAVRIAREAEGSHTVHDELTIKN